MKRYLFTALALLILLTPGLTSCGGSPALSPDSEVKAAIVDQLYLLEPNQAFIDQTTEMLESYGFKVDVWQGEEVTVNFYRELPRYGYKLIVLRAHSGILYYVENSEAVPMKTTYLFTGETYTIMKYVGEQITERVQNAQMTEDYPLVFVVNSQFITESMRGRFDNTAIIMMGCSSYYLDDMATAFVEKGASTYLGWNATVGLDYVDDATLNLIDNLCTKEMTMEEAIATTMTEVGRDPHYNTRLKYYPPQSGSQTIRELIK